MTKPEEVHWVLALLVITVAMGMLDAISLIHLGTFTGYMTGTVILIGIGLIQGSRITMASVVALSCYMVGALLGGRLVRRPHPLMKIVSDVLLGVAALVASTVVLRIEVGVLPVVSILGLAMGLQTSATRHAGVADMSMPAATMVLHGLAHDSWLAGGGGERAWRRLGTLMALISGAMLGAIIAAWNVPGALATVAALLLTAALILRRGPTL